jgi:hypothetical protein
MTDKELIKKLNTLQVIEPDPQYMKTTRYLILSSKESASAMPILHQGLFSRSFNMILSVSLAAIFLLVLSLSNGQLSSPTLEGVGSESLLSEADAITKDIDIRLQEIEYLADRPSIVALAEKNDAVITNEEEKIDKLLEEVISY